MARFNTLNKALMATALGAVLTSASLAQEAPAWIETDSQRQGYEIEERTRMNVVLTNASSDGVHSANGNHVKT